MVDQNTLINTLRQELISKQNEIDDLRACQSISENEIKRLQKLSGGSKRKSNFQNDVDGLSKQFPMLTNNQIALMTKKKKRVNWTCDEIAKGFTLSFFNRRGYDYLIHSLQYPLPSLRTLQIWSSNMSLVPGKMLTDSFIVLKALSETLSNGERQVR